MPGKSVSRSAASLRPGLQRLRMLPSLAAILAATGLAVVSASGAQAAAAKPAPAKAAAKPAVSAPANLPDWNGVWRAGSTLFDLSGPSKNVNGDPNARDFPPYNAEWGARYEKFLKDVVQKNLYSDPLTLCYPSGFPRLAVSARGFQIVITKPMVWFLYERPDIRYIHTDGRGHPPEEEALPTWNGHSIGHWEGETLVIDTVNLKNKVPIDRTGLVLSDQAHIVERWRRIDHDTMENVLTIEDSEAFTKPWVVTRRYRRDKGEALPNLDYVSCMENNRNKMVNGQTEMILRGDPRWIDPSEMYPPDVKKFAVP